MPVPNNEENAAKCICPNCPTYNECMKDGDKKLFCARGKTECPLEKKGCICGECPVASENGLTDLYFCEIGPAK